MTLNTLLMKIGDIDVKMTIIDITVVAAECAWFDVRMRLQIQVFNLDVLELNR